MTNDELKALCDRVLELHRKGSPTANLWKYSESQHEDPVTGHVKRFKHLYYRYYDHLAVEGDEQAGRDFQLIAEYRQASPTIATECLRLLAQCEAMRAVVYSARQVASYRHDPEAPLDAMFKALDRALSKLGGSHDK